MANEFIIKEWRPSSIIFSDNLSGGANVFTMYSSSGAGPGPVNGQILDISWKSNLVGGSLFITRSGIGDEIFRRNAPSGASTGGAWQTTTPVKLTENTLGSVAGGIVSQSFYCLEPLVINIAGSATTISGTTTTLIVRYL